MYTQSFKEEIGIVDVLNSQTITNTSVTSLGCNMANLRRVEYIVVTPSLGANGVLTGQLQASNTASFNTVVNTGTNLSNIGVANTANNNSISTIEIRQDQLAQLSSTSGVPNLQYVRLQLTGSGNPITALAIGQAKDVTQRPATQYNLNALFINQQQVSQI